MQAFQDRNSRALIYDSPAFGIHKVVSPVCPVMGSSPWPAESTGPACCETKGCDRLVKILQIARWKALDCQVNDEHTPKYITSLLPDGTTIETLDAIDGAVYCSIPLPIGLVLAIIAMIALWLANFCSERIASRVARASCGMALIASKTHRSLQPFGSVRGLPDHTK